ncbi:oligosaccharide flippase family protein [Candidatus Falkowbacteria bacterium]|nr:oligosaccharide flippase family protein [Candidatus Falkowbacteria bacterium]
MIVFFFPYELPIKLGVAVVTLAFFFNALNQILVGLFQKSLRMDKVSIAEIAGRIVLIGGIIAAIKLKSGLMGIMVTTVISGAINFLSNYLFSLKFARIKLAFDKDVWLQIVKKIWPLAITITLNLIYLKADTLILSLIKSQSEVGIYGAAYKVIDVFTAIPFMFAGVVLPIITFAWAENRERFKNIFQKSFDATVILALPIVIGAQFTAERVMTLVAGKEFAAAGPVLKILIMAAGIIFLGSMFAHAIIAIDRQRKIIGAYVFTSITAFFGYLFFIPTYSFFGAAWVTVYSELAIALASVFIFWKYAKFLPNFKIFLKSFLASLLMGATLYFLPSFNLFLTLAAAIIIYAGALYLFKGLKFVSFDSNYNS